MDLEEMSKLTETIMDWQALFPLKALMRKAALRCLLLMWTERKFNPTKMSSYFNYLRR
jgi:hypothetical protein